MSAETTNTTLPNLHFKKGNFSNFNATTFTDGDVCFAFQDNGTTGSIYLQENGIKIPMIYPFIPNDATGSNVNLYLPKSNNSNLEKIGYSIWMDVSFIPTTESSHWPVYVNNEGMVIECSSILGTEEKPFDNIHSNNFTFYNPYNSDGTGQLNAVDGLGLQDTYGEIHLWSEGLWGVSSSNEFFFDLHELYTEIYYEKNDESFGISLYPSGYKGVSNFLELKGNICLNSNYSYSNSHPSEVVVNAEDPYEGQIYFMLLD